MASILKRKDTYKITVFAGRDSNGKKINYYATFTPDSKKTRAQNNKDLDEFSREFEQKVKEGSYFDGDHMTLQEFSEKWLAECIKPKKAITTYDNYKMNLENHILPALGHMKLSKIRPIHIQRFCNELAENGRIDGKDKPLSSSTIKKINAILSSLFHRAVLWQLIESNPCQRVELPDTSVIADNCDVVDIMQIDRLLSTAGTMQEAEKCFTPEEAVLFLDVLDKSELPFQIKVFLNLSIFSGCRRGELLALTWRDIDFENSSIQIYKAVAKSKGQMILKVPKNKSSVRTLMLPQQVMDMLRQLKQEQREYVLKLGSAWKGKRGKEYDYNFLFTQWDGTLIYPTTPYSDLKKLIRNYNKTAAANAQLPDITLHDLRHTNATLLIAQNIDVKTVSKRLGHAQTSTTMNIYAHSLQKMDQTASEALESVLCKTSVNM
ncbi:MAG: tyrosine-type recombinase/integrase [Coprococcus sp.]